MYGQDLVNELERIQGRPLLPEEGAILVNFSAYLPFANKEMVSMDVALLEEVNVNVKNIFCSDNIIKNHRYPNKHYITLTQTNGTKRCKFGTFFAGTREQLNKMKYIAFQVLLEGVASYVGMFPIHLDLTEESPLTNISCVGGITSSENVFSNFRLTILQPNGCGCWIPHYIFTSEEDLKGVSDSKKSNCILLTKKSRYSILDGIHHIVTIYKEPTILYSCTREEIGLH